MSDLIDRQAAIDALDKVAEMFPYRIPGKAKTYRQYNEAWSDAIDAAENALESLPSAQPGWIPCSTALPEHDGEYLVTKKSFGWNCNEYTETDIARYEKKDGWHKANTVLAWCELPKPWEGGQDDGTD